MECGVKVVTKLLLLLFISSDFTKIQLNAGSQTHSLIIGDLALLTV